MKILYNLSKYLLIFIAFIWLSTSCEDYLEQPTDAVTTIDSVFSNPDNAMLALWAAYSKAFSWNHGLKDGGSDVGGYPPNGNNQNFGYAGNSMTFMFSDEAYSYLPWGSAVRFFNGTWNAFGQREFPTVAVVRACRTVNIFLENADKVPYQTTANWNWNEAFKNQVKAEARFMLAFLHFEFFRRYGGIPIIDRVPTFESREGGLTIYPSGERRSIKSVIDFIVGQCDQAIQYLPDSYSSAETGRITKGAALALKAKALLYAASPLYNSSTPPVPYGNELDSLLCYGNEDPSRWQLAVDAYNDAIVWAEANGYELMDDESLGKRESYSRGTVSPRSQTPVNKEAIFYLTNTPNALNNQFIDAGCPIWVSGLKRGQNGVGVNFVRNYYRDVNGINLDIPDTGSFPQLKAILRNAEPRFHACVWTPGTQYTNIDFNALVTNGGHDTAKFSYHLADGTEKLATTSNAIWKGEAPGFFNTKKWRQYGKSDIYISWTEFRLSELYLGLAEAMNEVNPNSQEIVNALNKIRVRGGIPILESGNPTYDARFSNKELMREEIRRERAIEHFAEEHRYFDVRRWKIASEVMGGEWKQIYLFENGTGTYENPKAEWTPEEGASNDATLSYKFVKFGEKIWDNKMYFYPWYQDEVNKGVLVQNPGW